MTNTENWYWSLQDWGVWPFFFNNFKSKNQNMKLIPKGSKLYSIIHLKCPRCHRGKFLQSPAYNMSKITRVRSHCEECNLNYKIEPSFYYGSMYVSYAVGVAIMVTIIGCFLIFSEEFSFLKTFITLVVVIALHQYCFKNIMGKLIF